MEKWTRQESIAFACKAVRECFDRGLTRKTMGRSRRDTAIVNLYIEQDFLPAIIKDSTRIPEHHKSVVTKAALSYIDMLIELSYVRVKRPRKPKV